MKKMCKDEKINKKIEGTKRHTKRIYEKKKILIGHEREIGN